MSHLPLCTLFLLLLTQSSVAFVTRTTVNPTWAMAMDLKLRHRDRAPSVYYSYENERPRSRKYTPLFIPEPLFTLHASSKERASSDLKELASRIDKNSARGPARARGNENQEMAKSSSRSRYQLGVGRNLPVLVSTDSSSNNNNPAVEQMEDIISVAKNWNVPQPATKKQQEPQRYDMGLGKHAPIEAKPSNEGDNDSNRAEYRMRTTMRLLPNRGEESARLTKAVWDQEHFVNDDSSMMMMFDGSELASPKGNERFSVSSMQQQRQQQQQQQKQQQHNITDYRQIDLSIPPSVYSLGSTPSSNIFSSSQSKVDLVWDLMRQEAQAEAAREPLLVSFLYSTILNHPTLESALSFHLANRLSSPAMLSTQIMSLIQEALDADPDFRRSLRADILAVRDRDPACHCLPDVFLYFKGFHALQTYRAAHYLWKSGRRVLAHYLQSQVSQHFQIDIHPNATLGSGIMLDHGTGIVIGETAHLGHNCSVLHHVTLGGSGKKGNDRHPKIGSGVLLGAGASVLGNIHIGDGCQVGAGTLVIDDLPPRSVAVGVPAKIIGRFVDVTAQPSIGMNQLGSKEAEKDIYMFGMDGI